MARAGSPLSRWANPSQPRVNALFSGSGERSRLSVRSAMAASQSPRIARIRPLIQAP